MYVYLHIKDLFVQQLVQNKKLLKTKKKQMYGILYKSTLKQTKNISCLFKAIEWPHVQDSNS